MDAKDLQRFIDEAGIDAEIVLLAETTPTVEAAAEAVGVQPAQIVKSVLFVVKDPDGAKRPQLVVTNGLSRVDYRALAAYLGTSRRRVRMARAPEVQAMTGYPVGTVPPFGHASPVPTVLDETVIEQGEVYAGGGAINALMRLRVEELQRVLRAEVVRLSA
jgi:Cys-tRNA(Pro) deacylase